jgi:4-carboxymuconolactone decarboxylase
VEDQAINGEQWSTALAASSLMVRPSKFLFEGEDMKAISFMTAVAFRTSFGLLSSLTMTPSAIAQPNDPREARGLQVITTLSDGAGQPVLDALRRDMPALGDAVLKYALGEVFGSETLDIRTRQLAVVAAFAAQGNLPYLKIHAGYALSNGATPQELLDIALVTTVTAGFPRAIDAAHALRDVFAERGIALPLAKN